MAAISTIVAIGALAIGTLSYVSQVKSNKEAQRNVSRANSENKKTQAEQKALNAQKAANERRQQIREERVRRAQVEQSAENTGVAGSSGELGAVSGLTTQLGANIGTNLGQLQGVQNINNYSQAAADFSTAANRNQSDASSAASIFSLAGNVFQGAGGFSTLQTAYNRA